MSIPNNKRGDVRDFGDSVPDNVVDLSNFQPLTAEFDLFIRATEEIKTSVTEDPNQISSPVYPFSKLLQSGKPFLRELLAVEVAFPNKLANDAQLPNTASEDRRFRSRSEHIRSNVCELLANI